MTDSSGFWDALAPYHYSIEKNFFELNSLERIISNIHEPVLVVGAGQGLIVEELQNNGFKCDGIDSSSEMIKYAEKRRGIKLIKADAKKMPFENGMYQTTICATGVFDLVMNEEEIKLIINEVKRVTDNSGNIFIVFVRVSPATEELLKKVGMLKDNIIYGKQSMEAYLLSPIQLIADTAKKANIGFFNAFLAVLKFFICSTMKEKKYNFNMQKILKQVDDPEAFFKAYPERHPFRNESALKSLFKNLEIPIKRLSVNDNCFVVQL